MGLHLQSASRWGHSTLATSCGRIEARPPSRLQSQGTICQRLLHWLKAPAPTHAAAAPSHLDAVRDDFLAALADIASAEAADLRLHLYQARSLQGLWHLRAEVYRAVGLAHSQAEAEQRIAGLNRHFPTRAPRSSWVPL